MELGTKGHSHWHFRHFQLKIIRRIHRRKQAIGRCRAERPHSLRPSSDPQEVKRNKEARLHSTLPRIRTPRSDKLLRRQHKPLSAGQDRSSLPSGVLDPSKHGLHSHVIILFLKEVLTFTIAFISCLGRTSNSFMSASSAHPYRLLSLRCSS